MPQCAPSIISGFSSANVPLTPSSHSELLALLGQVGAVVVVGGVWRGYTQTMWFLYVVSFMCACISVRFSKVRSEICYMYVWGIWGMQGCKVSTSSSPDELAGICKRWITSQRESIIQRRKKKGNINPASVAPGSLFQFREWFSQNVEGKRREAALKERAWDDEGGVGVKPQCASPHLSPPSFSVSPYWSKSSVKMQNAIIRPSEYTNATYDGWVWDLERPPVQHRLISLLKWPVSFSSPVSCI